MQDILQELFPSQSVIFIVSPLSVFCIFLFLFCSGKLKLTFNITTNYTRKLFHILVFSVAGIIGYLFGFKAVMLYGGITGLIMIFVIWLGEGNILYEGIGREQDIPHRSFYIGVPFISTAIAGLINNYLFIELALVGYLVAGWGDAIGEPVGVRFGKHRYRVPSLRNVQCTRSIEGSLAIMGMSIFGTIVALFLIGDIPLEMIILAGVITGLATAAIEAFSPHGIDNFTTQVASAAICFGIVNVF